MSSNEIGKALGSMFGSYAALGLLGVAADSKDTSGRSSAERLKGLARKLKGTKIVHEDGPTSIEFRGAKPGAPSALLAEDPTYILRAKRDEANSALMHELGHIENDKMWGRPGRAIAHVSRAAAMGAQPFTSILAAIDSKKSYGPALAQAAVSVPMLVDEALASGRVVRKLIDEKGFAKGLREALPLAPALGTYLLHAATPAVITTVRRS